MKRPIVICCPAMLKAIGNRDLVVVTEGVRGTQDGVIFNVTIRERSGNRINNCPYCKEDLPFPFLEEKDEQADDS